MTIEEIAREVLSHTPNLEYRGWGNVAEKLARAVIEQAEEIARLRARIVELEDQTGIADNVIQELEAK